MEEYKILISSISNYYFCPRRFYLNNIEETLPLEDNTLMIEGEIQHKNAHAIKAERRNDYIKVSNMTLFSSKYNISGKSDIVEFWKDDEYGVFIKEFNSKNVIIPIEYKHGVINRDDRDYQVQLCAQVLCLEEMYSCNINYGYLYFVNSNKRKKIEMNEDLRKETIYTIDCIKKEIETRKYISPVFKNHCKNCSMFKICSPQKTSVKDYFNTIMEDF